MGKKRNFKNIHGINPISLTFVKQSNKQQESGTEIERCDAFDTIDDDDDDEDDDEDECSTIKDGQENSLKLEKEYLTLPDEFFIFHIFFALFLCMVIGINKVVIIPNWNDNQRIRLSLLGLTGVIILSFFFYSYRNSTKVNLK